MAWRRRVFELACRDTDTANTTNLVTLVSTNDGTVPRSAEFRVWWVPFGVQFVPETAAEARVWAASGAPGCYFEGSMSFAGYDPDTNPYGDVVNGTLQVKSSFYANASELPDYPTWAMEQLIISRRGFVQYDEKIPVVTAAIPRVAQLTPVAADPSAWLWPPVQIAQSADVPDWIVLTDVVIGTGGAAAYQAKGGSGGTFGAGAAAIDAAGGDGVDRAAGGQGDTGAGLAGTPGTNVPEFDASIGSADDPPDAAFQGGGHLERRDAGDLAAVTTHQGYVVVEYNAHIPVSAGVSAVVALPGVTATAVVSSGAAIFAEPPRPTVTARGAVGRLAQISARASQPEAVATAKVKVPVRGQITALSVRPILIAIGTVKVPVRAQVVATLPRPVVSAVALDRIPGHIVAVVPRPTVNANAARVIVGQADVGPSPPRILATLWIEVHAPGYQTDPWERLPWDRR